MMRVKREGIFYFKAKQQIIFCCVFIPLKGLVMKNFSTWNKFCSPSLRGWISRIMPEQNERQGLLDLNLHEQAKLPLYHGNSRKSLFSSYRMIFNNNFLSSTKANCLCRALSYLKKKQTSRWQEDSMLSDFEWQSIFEPDNVWLRNAFGFAVYSDWIVARHCRVDGMLDNSGNLEGCKEIKRREWNQQNSLRLFPPFFPSTISFQI